MGNHEGRERDAELALQAGRAEKLARECEEAGRHRDAAQYLAVATFLRDCMSRRVSRFRGPAVQRRRLQG